MEYQKMTDLVVNSDNALQDAIGIIRELYVRNRYLKVSIKIGKGRSTEQNSISHAWYEQLSRELREDNALGWKAYCKLTIGVPILRAEVEEFRTNYDASVKLLTYEQKLKAMHFVPVTSLMTKPQLSQYLEAMQEHFRTNHKVMLEFPPEDK